MLPRQIRSARSVIRGELGRSGRNPLNYLSPAYGERFSLVLIVPACPENTPKTAKTASANEPIVNMKARFESARFMPCRGLASIGIARKFAGWVERSSREFSPVLCRSGGRSDFWAVSLPALAAATANRVAQCASPRANRGASLEGCRRVYRRDLSGSLAEQQGFVARAIAPGFPGDGQDPDRNRARSLSGARKAQIFSARIRCTAPAWPPIISRPREALEQPFE